MAWSDKARQAAAEARRLRMRARKDFSYKGAGGRTVNVKSASVDVGGSIHVSRVAYAQHLRQGRARAAELARTGEGARDLRGRVSSARLYADRASIAAHSSTRREVLQRQKASLARKAARYKRGTGVIR